MKMTLNEMVTASAALRKISLQDVNIKLAYSLYKIIVMLNPHLEYFDTHREQVQKAVIDKDSALQELLLQEIDLGDFQKLDFSIAENANISLSAVDIIALEKLINFT